MPRIDDALGFARERQMLLVRHELSGVDLDVSLAWLPFEIEAIRRSEPRDYAGVAIRVPRVEDLVIGHRLDLQHITTTVREFAEALEDPGRIVALERLLKKTGLER